jgi:spore coat polysaccharide biosynthesis predicted glycosyltransferase SpsG
VKTVWFAGVSSTKVGLGHLARILALAEQFRSKGVICCFQHMCIFDNRGKELLYESQFEYTCNCSGLPDLIVIDSYDSVYIENCIRSTNARSLLIVDETSPEVFADYYVEASPIRKWKPLNTNGQVFKFKHNPILRETFDKPLILENPKNYQLKVLITLGATELDYEILEVLIHSIRKFTIFSKCITVVSSNLETRERLGKAFPDDLKLISNFSFFKDVLRNFDFVISAGGVTAWELISLGVPGMLIGVADNQYYQISYLQKHGLRNGINYRKSDKFQDEISTILNLALQDSNIIHLKRKKLRNGRIEVVNWVFDIMKYYQR